MLSFLGLSTGFQAGPMAMKQTVCITKPVTMMAGSASIGEAAAKKAWLANNPPAYGPGAAKGQAGARRGGAPGRSAAATIAASKAAWNANHPQVAGKASAYRSPAFGDNSAAMRPMSSPAAMRVSETKVAQRSAYAPPAVAPPVPAAPAPAPVAYTMVGVGGDEAAAKAAWLAKLDAPKFGPNKGRKAAPTRKSSTYRNPSMGDNM
tara:strand:- start:116 stop:733 length:618 start_codon:yes stop_codon:yes gene_type:complete